MYPETEAFWSQKYPKFFKRFEKLHCLWSSKGSPVMKEVWVFMQSYGFSISRPNPRFCTTLVVPTTNEEATRHVTTFDASQRTCAQSKTPLKERVAKHLKMKSFSNRSWDLRKNFWEVLTKLTVLTLHPTFATKLLNSGRQTTILLQHTPWAQWVHCSHPVTVTSYSLRLTQ